MQTRAPLAILAAVALASIAACGSANRAAPPPNIVTIIADHERFQAPDTVPAGLTTLHLVTRGAEMHQVALARIGGGHTFDEFLSAMRAPPPPPEWVAMAGGVNPPRPGGTADVTLALEPGRYALLCLVPGADGLPHVVKGMHKELVVVRTNARAAAEPAATDTLTLGEDTFTSSALITAGRHVFRVVNTAPHPHEVTFVRLDPGKTADNMLRWLTHPVGTPPGEMLGGVFGMQPGQHAFVTVDFSPGEYLFFCSLLADADGRPYFTHGMVRQVTVR